MRLLFDSHTFLWYITKDPKLSSTAEALLNNAGNDLFLSFASVWEIGIKSSLGKLPLFQTISSIFPAQVYANRVDFLHITLAHLLRVPALQHHHKDPFDRMLVAQCEVENLPIVSRDTAFDAYGIQRFW